MRWYACACVCALFAPQHLLSNECTAICLPDRQLKALILLADDLQICQWHTHCDNMLWPHTHTHTHAAHIERHICRLTLRLFSLSFRNEIRKHDSLNICRCNQLAHTCRHTQTHTLTLTLQHFHLAATLLLSSTTNSTWGYVYSFACLSIPKCICMCVCGVRLACPELAP